MFLCQMHRLGKCQLFGLQAGQGDVSRENKKNTKGCQEVVLTTKMLPYEFQNVFSSLMDVYSHSNVITSMAEWF